MTQQNWEEIPDLIHDYVHVEDDDLDAQIALARADFEAAKRLAHHADKRLNELLKLKESK
ncbi:hypothetical protein SHEEN_56 [Mycobacterium phage Sheen]|uniref:Uncharacterized protein n=1 Tax=Mycobacterium phage Sheen TaxID=1589274 RepID=A0A0B5A3M8_9CAUD|nr:hypothetical protein AVV31_gp38 [Mycobacterium phage Sheen]AJD82474.1 hypothetical protein SHEEN_56 [Mycobacterium phage Sheen]